MSVVRTTVLTAAALAVLVFGTLLLPQPPGTPDQDTVQLMSTR